jgi:hypothetical protein
MAMSGWQPTGGFWSDVKSGISKAYNEVKDAGKWVVNKHVDALKGVTKAACKLSNSSLAPAAASGAAAAYGAPPQAGAAGVQAVQSMCSSPQPAPAPVMAAGGSPSWLLPAAVGGGALLLVLVLRRK